MCYSRYTNTRGLSSKLFMDLMLIFRDMFTILQKYNRMKTALAHEHLFLVCISAPKLCLIPVEWCFLPCLHTLMSSTRDVLSTNQFNACQVKSTLSATVWQGYNTSDSRNQHSNLKDTICCEGKAKQMYETSF